ncbi:LytR/AlgR family response regulator transcription factor [Spongiivirga citrea]|uniref:LytTR family transcriptional regulator n=1 Tax=Spongiivirga citrea TaxID=1481457 RepID=A0A6M0CEC9_9FLAO|nr:LytTR family transcriptional regulator DNA-binding domain-containing protein [Spongiivirga citrea]NER16175.1 LytTR family transcriptional regulator [Spongiivirga citrea]
MPVNAIDYLKNPYPYYYSSIRKVIAILLLISALSFLFSYVFEPFEVNRAEHKIDYFWICVIHSVVPLLLGIVFFSVLNNLIKEETDWSIGKEALWISIYLFLVGIGSFLIRDVIYDKPDNWSSRYFFEEIRNTFLVGILIVAVVLPLNLERLLSKYKKKAKGINLNSSAEPKEVLVTIKTPLKSEYFDLKLSDFVFAKVDGNYTDIFLRNETGANRTMVRISLKELENQLKDYVHIIKTHRSFLVNSNYINSVSGNAQGYMLSLSGVKDKIPVSRANIRFFDTTISRRN